VAGHHATTAVTEGDRPSCVTNASYTSEQWRGDAPQGSLVFEKCHYWPSGCWGGVRTDDIELGFHSTSVLA
jgi:hypothetical protein